MGADGKWVHGPAGQRSRGKAREAGVGKRETVIRKAGGKVWEDQTLLEWDPGACRSGPFPVPIWLLIVDDSLVPTVRRRSVKRRQ